MTHSPSNYPNGQAKPDCSATITYRARPLGERPASPNNHPAKVARMRFILASASPARLGILEKAGIDPVVRVSGIDEDAVAASLINPTHADLVTALATAKAEAVAALVVDEYPNSVVVGCDSMLAMPGPQGMQIVGKPANRQQAWDRWQYMRGNKGELLTGHCVIRITDGKIAATAADSLSTTVRFDTPTDAELNAYLATKEPLTVAGAFTLDGLGGWFVQGVDGDPLSIIGISLPLTRALLTKVGVNVTDLWN